MSAGGRRAGCAVRVRLAACTGSSVAGSWSENHAALPSVRQLQGCGSAGHTLCTQDPDMAGTCSLPGTALSISSPPLTKPCSRGGWTTRVVQMWACTAGRGEWSPRSQRVRAKPVSKPGSLASQHPPRSGSQAEDRPWGQSHLAGQVGPQTCGMWDDVAGVSGYRSGLPIWDSAHFAFGPSLKILSERPAQALLEKNGPEIIISLRTFLQTSQGVFRQDAAEPGAGTGCALYPAASSPGGVCDHRWSRSSPWLPHPRI